MTTNNNNKMKTYYIGTRAKWNDIGDVLGRDDVARLNQGLSKSIRTSVMKSGIKKTEQGARLEFYSVSNDEFDKLMKEQDTRVRPLVRVDEELLNKTLTDVNNKYGGRMDYDTHRKYLRELAEGFDKCVEIVGDDLNTRSKPKQNPLIIRKNTLVGKALFNLNPRDTDERVEKAEEFLEWCMRDGYIREMECKHDYWQTTDEWKKENPHIEWKSPTTEQSFCINTNNYDDDEFRKVRFWWLNSLHSKSRSYTQSPISYCKYTFDNEGLYRLRFFGSGSENRSITFTENLNDLYKKYINRKELENEDFIQYVANFYLDGGIRSSFFNENPLTIDEIIEAVNEYVEMADDWEDEYGGDTIDREIVRDILFYKRGCELKYLEYSFYIKTKYLKEILTEYFIEDVWKYNSITRHGMEEPTTELERKKRLKEWEIDWKSDEMQKRVVEMLGQFNNNILKVA